MKTPRLVIYDAWQGKYLEIAIMPTGDCRAVVTLWTHRREQAFRFQSIKAARRMAEALGGEAVIHNERGEIIQ